MSNIKVYYADCADGPFGRQYLVRESNLIDKNFSYAKCPIFKHKSNRTFIGVSPVDFSIQIDREKKQITTDNFQYLHIHDEDLNSPRPVLQLSFASFVFWTEEPDVWIDYNDHPITSLNNNFITVNGWFNISNWIRNTSLGITIIDDKKPIVIKKGDPLFRVSFYSPNLDNGIILKKVEDPQKVQQVMLDYKQKHQHENKPFWKNMVFSKTKSCPFKFLHNK